MPSADHDWNAWDTNTKSIEHLLCIRVAIEIDVPERMRVPGQELPHVQRPRVVRRSEHYDVTQVPGDQPEAPLQERAQEDLAQFRVGLHEFEQLVSIELDHLARLGHAHAEDRASAGDHRAFAGKLAARMRRDQRVARLGTHNLQLAGYDDEQRDTPVAGVVQHFAERRRTAPPADRHSGDLRRRQRRKGVLRVDNGGLQKAHR